VSAAGCELHGDGSVDAKGVADLAGLADALTICALSRLDTTRDVEVREVLSDERKGDADKYRQQVKTWFELLREAWERAVEEKLFNGVVGRFQPGIKTMSLSSVRVTPELTSAVEKGMTQASKWTHDQAPALNRPPPKAADLKATVDDLEAFVSQFGGKTKQPPSTKSS